MGNDSANDEAPKTDGKGNKFLAEFQKVEKKTCGSCGKGCCKGIVIFLCVIVILVGIVEIAACVTTALATKLFSSDLSGRLVSLIVLTVTAAVALSVGIYAVVGLFRKKRKALHVAGVVLVIMAIIQALICGLAIKITPKDDMTLAESLKESFKLASAGNPRHVKLWAITSSDLQCCGLYGPEDYRDPRVPPIFAPDVPISCCPTYNASKSDLVQETARETCRANRSFFDVGCGTLVKNVFRNSAAAVMATSIVLIVFEVILSFHVYIMYRVYKKQERRYKGEKETEEKKTVEAGGSSEQK